MAKMRNISIKAIKEFEGMEGPAMQGNLYVGSKKVAFWSQDGDGAIEDHLCMEPGYSKEKLRRLFSDGSGGIDIGFECFMNDLSVLAAEEKEYKKYARKGLGVMVRKSTDSFAAYLFVPAENASLTDGQILEKYRDDIGKLRVYGRRGEEPKIEIVRSVQEFTVAGDEIELKDIAE